MKQTVTGELSSLDLTRVLEKKCSYCVHIKVCAVYRAVKPLMNNWEEQDAPLDVNDLAKICREFRLACNGVWE